MLQRPTEVFKSVGAVKPGTRLRFPLTLKNAPSIVVIGGHGVPVLTEGRMVE